MSETTPAGPAIDLARLSGADMRLILAMQKASGDERVGILLDLLERVIDGGLAGIPLPVLPAYIRRFDDELAEMLNPKG